MNDENLSKGTELLRKSQIAWYQLNIQTNQLINDDSVLLGKLCPSNGIENPVYHRSGDVISTFILECWIQVQCLLSQSELLNLIECWWMHIRTPLRSPMFLLSRILHFPLVILHFTMSKQHTKQTIPLEQNNKILKKDTAFGSPSKFFSICLICY